MLLAELFVVERRYVMIVEVEHQRHDVDLIKIDNDETKIVFSNYGARIVSWKYHDNNIILGNVVEADEFYFENPFNFGATIGRYAGRIKDASFKLDGHTYELENNDDVIGAIICIIGVLVMLLPSRA